MIAFASRAAQRRQQNRPCHRIHGQRASLPAHSYVDGYSLVWLAPASGCLILETTFNSRPDAVSNVLFKEATVNGSLLCPHAGCGTNHEEAPSLADVIATCQAGCQHARAAFRGRAQPDRLARPAAEPNPRPVQPRGTGGAGELRAGRGVHRGRENRTRSRARRPARRRPLRRLLRACGRTA